MNPTVTYDPGKHSTSATFRTHLNYIKCVERLTQNLRIAIKTQTKATLDITKVSKFEKLSNITKISINGEKEACDRERAYAQVASPWIPVKCYYRLYYLEVVFLYLLSSSLSGFGRGGHAAVRKVFRNALKSNDIEFSGVGASEISSILIWETASQFNAPLWSNVGSNYYNDPNCGKSLSKKLAQYIELDWKQENKIPHYKTKVARQCRLDELFPKEFSLVDYFYWMRIKANYRDVDFLDFENSINENDAYEYLSYYIKATDHYADALESAIILLKKDRGMTK